jgi:hypothetical protein
MSISEHHFTVQLLANKCKYFAPAGTVKNTTLKFASHISFTGTKNTGTG